MATKLKHVITLKFEVDTLPGVAFTPGPDEVDLAEMGLTPEQIKSVETSGWAVPADMAAADAAVKAEADARAAVAEADKPVAYPHWYGDPAKAPADTWEGVWNAEKADKTAKREAKAAERAEKAEETAATAVQSLPLGKE